MGSLDWPARTAPPCAPRGSHSAGPAGVPRPPGTDKCAKSHKIATGPRELEALRRGPAVAQGFLTYAMVRAVYSLILLTTGHAKTGRRASIPGHGADSACDLFVAATIGLHAGFRAIADMPGRARRRGHDRRTRSAAGQEQPRVKVVSPRGFEPLLPP